MRRLSQAQEWLAPILVVLVTAGAVTAAEPASIPPLTDLAALIAAAERADAGLQAIDAQRSGAKASRQGAGRWDDPRLELEGGRRTEDGEETWRGRALLIQRLPLSGERAARIAMADAAQTEIESAAVMARLALVTDIRHLAVELRQALAREAADRTALADATAAFDAVRARLASGEARDADALAAQIDQEEASKELELTAQRVVAARTQLARRCAVNEAAIGNPEPIQMPRMEQAAARAATARHPRLGIAEAALGSAEAAARASRAARRGDVHAGVFSERDGDANEVGLVVEIPVPLWNRNASPVATAEAAARMARFTRDQVRRQLEADAEQSWFTADAARRRAEHHQERLLPVARQALSLALADYSAGHSEIAAVLIARRTLSRLASETADAAAESDHALIDLHAAISGGEDLP